MLSFRGLFLIKISASICVRSGYHRIIPYKLINYKDLCFTVLKLGNSKLGYLTPVEDPIVMDDFVPLSQHTAWEARLLSAPFHNWHQSHHEGSTLTI